jgi:hypothetical protein
VKRIAGLFKNSDRSVQSLRTAAPYLGVIAGRTGEQRLKETEETMKARNGKQWLRNGIVLVVALVALGSLTSCAVVTMIHGGAKKPAAEEFGLGPRASATGLYTATLNPAEKLRTRRLQTVEVTLHDAAGQPIDGAAITIDGGMPQHGHGLPTKPRVTKALGNGVYVIEGVRFNMGGWWEFKVAVAGKAGNDTVTFNLAL